MNCVKIFKVYYFFHLVYKKIINSLMVNARTFAFVKLYVVSNHSW